MCDQCPPLNLKKKKKKLVGIYKFKKYGFAKVPTLIFILNPHFRFRKNKIKGDKSITIIANTPKNPKLQHSPHITKTQIT